MKKRLISLLVASTMLLSMVGCGSDDTTDTSADTADTTTSTEAGDDAEETVEYQTLDVMTSPDFNGVLLSYVVDQGWAEEIGLELNITEYANGTAGNEGLAAGLWDVGFEGMAYVFGVSNNDAKLVCTSSMTQGDTLFVRADSEILDVQGFNPTYADIYGDTDTVSGAQILCAVGTSTHQLALKYIEKIGLSSDDISIVPLDYATCVSTFALGEGDIVALPTPYSLQVESEYGWVAIAELSDFTTSTTDIIVSAEAYEEKSVEIIEFMKLCFRAAEELEADHELKTAQIIKYYTECGKEITEEEAAQEAELRIFVTVEDHQTLDYGVAEADAANFLAEIGSIEPEQAEIVIANVVDDLWKIAVEEYDY